VEAALHGGSPSSYPGAVLAALRDTGWMIRRKDFVRFGSESLLRRSHSFDFEVPHGVWSEEGGRAIAKVPLGFWWKAPGKYTNIDFEDEEGTSLSLSTSEEDEWLTLQVLLRFATEILSRDPTALTWKTAQDISMIVGGDPVWARAEVKDWRAAAIEPPCCQLDGAESSPIASEIDRGVLAQEEEFLALLEISAMASVFTVPLTESKLKRRVIKLRYEESCSGRRGTDTFNVPASAKARWAERRRRLLLASGLASYEVDLANAFVRARRYHFEGDAPAGLRYTNVRYKTALRPQLRRAEDTDPRVHLMDSNVADDTYFSVRGDLVVSDDWLTLALICTVAALAVLIGILDNVYSLDPTASQSVIALAVLVPSVATSIVWRRVHWLVTRLQGGLRMAFGFIGLLLFYLALRIAESPTAVSVKELPATDSGFLDRAQNFFSPHLVTVSRLANASEIQATTWVCLIWTALVGIVLVAARIRSRR
jgi:hypothetical protein